MAKDIRSVVEDRLSAVDGLRMKKAFGGLGIYSGGTVFGVLHQGRLYFKTDEETRAKYLDWGMEPFQPTANQVMKQYYEVPGDVVQCEDELLSLAEEAASLPR